MGQSHSVGSGHIPPHGRSGISHRNRWPDPRHSYRYIPAYADRGTPYRVRQQELNDLEDPNGRRQFGGPYLSMNEAARMMEEIGASALTPAQHAAVDRLQALEQVGSYGGDIIFKTFNDLDLVFFRGSLRGNVNLAWTDIGPHDRDRSAGVTRDSRPPQRVRIELNEFVLKIPRAGLRDVWATLLHEMVHAYLMVVCGPRMESDDAPRPGQRPVPRHGQYFSRSLKAVRHRLGSKDGAAGEAMPGCNPAGTNGGRLVAVAEKGDLQTAQTASHMEEGAEEAEGDHHDLADMGGTDQTAGVTGVVIAMGLGASMASVCLQECRVDDMAVMARTGRFLACPGHWMMMTTDLGDL
ncbi:MAG: hypothetical protein M1817_005248 [Caeruleum heppii]|nr:MAG: hypothetical protein M1817_005248 [Caeruleum heppii]